MARFDHPLVLLLALACGALVAVLLLAGHARRRQRLARYGSAEAISRLAPVEAARRPTARALRLALATTALGVALAGPRWGASTAILESEGIDVALALDVSLSMLAEDERPNRLERVKQEVRRLRASAPGDRAALIAFAGRSYILAPLTADDGAIELFLDNLEPSVVGQQGSALTPPLRQAMQLLTASRGDADRAIVLMSDGEAFDDRDEALRVAAEIAEAGIHLVVVGFGTPGGATIPLPGTGGRDVKRDENDEIVVTRGDDVLLAAVAEAAKGAFIPSDATDKGNRIRRALAQLEAAARAETLRANRPARYQWFAALALLLLFADALEGDGARRPRWLRLPSWRRPRTRERRHRPRAVAWVPWLPLAATLAGLGPSLLQAQQASFDRALSAQRDGRLVEAIREYRGVIAAGDRRGVVLYNLGTALLAADSLDAAIETLERATFAGEAELRREARFNLGVAFLRRGLRQDGEGRSIALQGARRAFRTVLLETPGDADAQWNYELALRAPTGGGGGGGGPPQPEGQPPTEAPGAGPMSRQQAEALLDAASRDERETQARRRRGDPTTRTAGRDW